MTLLDLGANPEKLSLSEGDTPLHVAVKIALEEEPGPANTFAFLFLLLSLLCGIHIADQLIKFVACSFRSF